jgi:hypothetical protein
MCKYCRCSSIHTTQTCVSHGLKSTGIVLSAHKQLPLTSHVTSPHLLHLVPIHMGLYKQDCLGFSMSFAESLSDLD